MKCMANKNDTEVKKIMQKERLHTARVILVSLASVLTDKYGFGKRKINQVMKSIFDRADSINQGYISLADLEQILKDEYDIVIK